MVASLFPPMPVTHGGHPFIFEEAGFSGGRNELQVEMTLKRKTVRLSVTHESFPEEEIRWHSYGFAKRRTGFWFIPLEPPEIVVLSIAGCDWFSAGLSGNDGTGFAPHWFWLPDGIFAVVTAGWKGGFCTEQPVWLALFREGHGPDT